MPLEQLTYTPPMESANDHPSTMMLLVDDELYHKYRCGNTIPLAEIVGSFEVTKFAGRGNEGNLVHPSNSEKMAVFGTIDSTEIVKFMLQHGTLRVKHHGKDKKIKEPVSTVETLLHADRRVY